MPLKIEYWTDPMCIWAYVAESRYDAVIERWADRIEVQHRLVPIFGSLAWRFHRGPWANGGVADRIIKTRQVAKANGFDSVSGECWSHAPTSSWAAACAVTAVFAMEGQGDAPPRSGAKYQTALRKHFFEDNKDISRRRVQLDLADRLKLSTSSMAALLDNGEALALVWEAHHERESRQIQGSPTWELDSGRCRMYGNFHVRALHATIESLLESDCEGGTPC